MKTTDDIGQISIFELELLSSLGAHSSLRSLGRQKKLEPPHLSKILGRLEKKLKTTLMLRSPKGIVLTPQGLRLVQIAREMMPFRDALSAGQWEDSKAQDQLISIAAPRFVASHIIAPLLSELKGTSRGLRFRLLDMAPDELESAAIKSACEVVVSVESLGLTKAWESEKCGTLSWGLFASSRHPIGPSATEAAVAEYPFMVPTYWRHDGFEKGEDGCPLPWKKRKLGDETSSVLTAIEALRGSPDQLLFAPRIVLKGLIAAKEVVEIKVRDWKKVERPIYLSLRTDLVSKQLQKKILLALFNQLKRQ